MRKRVTVLFVGVAAILLLSGGANAGGLSEGFVEVLAKAQPGEVVTGLVFLDEQIDFEVLEADIAARGFTSRWRRHQIVIGRAKDLAARTQPELIAWLEQRLATGEILAYRPYWVVNAIAVDARTPTFDAIGLRQDIGLVYENAEVWLRPSEDEGPSDVQQGGPLPGHVCINLQTAWAQGYMGQGRLVCAFDSGVDGTHVALSTKWRGVELGVEWWEAWFDPLQGTQFPFDNGTHGTHVMGIMVAEPPDFDPVGVAYQARWIAAGVVVSPLDAEKVIQAYEWAADPDGQPGTIDDVPDVVNNSWGTSADCDDTFWAAIDLVEAAGIANVIAVDNSGPAPFSVNSPESRVTTPFSNFSVGNVDPHQQDCPIRFSSGRGPSPCDSSSVKPEVTAPGTTIISTIPGDLYSNKTGTSQAAPHVSGAMTILRQANPDLEVDEMKQILMDTARDQGDVGEDNTYGWGVINVGAALEFVLNMIPNLPPPTAFSGLVDPPNNVNLTWVEPEGDGGSPLMYYNIYRAPSGQNFPEDSLAMVPADTTAFTDVNVPGGVTNYALTAIYEAGESGAAIVQLNVPYIGPSDLTAELIYPYDVKLDWLPPVGPDSVEAYSIYRAPGEEPFPVFELIGSVPADSLTFTEEDVEIGIHKYGVSGVFDRGESPMDTVMIEVPVAAAAPETDGLHARLWLEGRPTPMTSRGVLRFNLPSAEPARIVIYDVGGRAVRRVDLKGNLGSAEVAWNGRDDNGRSLPSGIYFAELNQGRRTVKSRLVIVR